MNQQEGTRSEAQVASSSKHQSPWLAGAMVFVVAVVADLAILGIAVLAGTDMVATPPGGPTMSVGLGAIPLALFVTVAVGTLALAALGKGRASRWRLIALVGLVVGVLSVAGPLTADATIGT